MIGKHKSKQAKIDKLGNRTDIAPVGEQRLAQVERLDDEALEGVVGGYMPIITHPPANNIR